MLRQRTPSRLRPESNFGDQVQDRDWNDLLKRRKAYKDNFDRIKSEIDDATKALQNIGSSIRPTAEIEKDFEWKHNTQGVTSQQSRNFSINEKSIQDFSTRNTKPFQDSSKLNASSFERPSQSSIPSRWEGVENKFPQQAKKIAEPSSRRQVGVPAHPSSLPQARPNPPPSSHAFLGSEFKMTASQFNLDRVNNSSFLTGNRERNNLKVSTTTKTKPNEIILKNLKSHDYDRLVFREESCTLFRERYEEKLSRAKSLLSKFNLNLAVTAAQAPLTSTQEKLPTIFDDSLKARNSFPISKTYERTSLPVATSFSNQTWQVCSSSPGQGHSKNLHNLKPKTDFYNSTLERAKLENRHILLDKAQKITTATPTSGKCDYKLHLGQLHSEDMEELKQIEIEENHLLMQKDLNDFASLSLNKTKDLNNQDSDSESNKSPSCASPMELNFNNSVSNSSPETLTKSSGTIMIPNHLMNRWQTLFKADDSDSDSESEYDYEEDDPNSPYHTEMTLDIEPEPESLSLLTKWVKSISSHEKNFLDELNQKVLGSSSWTIVEERIQHPKTREVLGLADVSHCDKVRNGFFREFDVHGKDITSFGRYAEGQKVGIIWKRLEGNGFLIGANDTNNNQETAIYLYPDLTCAISGTFENGKLKSGKFGKVIGISYEEEAPCIPVPKVQILRQDLTFTYDPSMTVSISRSPLIRDPYEHQNVYVANSKIQFAGEGLYAKRNLAAGTLIALFNGIRQREIGYTKKMTEFSDYRIGMGSGEVCLDIPDLYISLDKYCATTGHKACHSFVPNATFKELTHPRFGRIMSIVAEEDIPQHHEVLVSYNYRIHQAPQWYQELYFQHLREDEKLEEDQIYMIARRIMRQHGVTLSIPHPSLDSPRFSPCGVCRDHVGHDDYAISCDTCEKWHHVRCTPIKTADIFEEDERGNKIAKTVEWSCHLCVAISNTK